MRIIEIRINSFALLGNCVLCNDSGEDPDWGASGKANAPELFTFDENGNQGWVCTFCARNYAPALAELICMARAAERYAGLLFDGKAKKPSPETQDITYQLAIKVDTVAADGPCGLCGHETVSSSYPTYKPGFPEMFFGDKIVCSCCGDQYAPVLDALCELAQTAERYLEHTPFEKRPLFNSNPEMNAVLDSLGWVRCPNCNKRFSTMDKNRWSEGIHLSCGQRIKLKEPIE